MHNHTAHHGFVDDLPFRFGCCPIIIDIRVIGQLAAYIIGKRLGLVGITTAGINATSVLILLAYVLNGITRNRNKDKKNYKTNNIHKITLEIKQNNEIYRIPVLYSSVFIDRKGCIFIDNKSY